MMIDKILTGFFFLASIFLLVSHADAAEVEVTSVAQEITITRYEDQVK